MADTKNVLDMLRTGLAGLKMAGGASLSVILQKAAVTPECLDFVARAMAAADDEDWSKLKGPAKHVWKMRASAAITALHKFLINGDPLRDH